MHAIVFSKFLRFFQINNYAPDRASLALSEAQLRAVHRLFCAGGSLDRPIDTLMQRPRADQPGYRRSCVALPRLCCQLEPEQDLSACHPVIVFSTCVVLAVSAVLQPDLFGPSLSHVLAILMRYTQPATNIVEAWSRILSLQRECRRRVYGSHEFRLPRA